MTTATVERRVRERRANGTAGQTEKVLRRRAVEAVIWGMPAVNFDRMLRAAIKNGGKANQMIFWSRPVNSKNQDAHPGTLILST